MHVPELHLSFDLSPDPSCSAVCMWYASLFMEFM